MTRQDSSLPDSTFRDIAAVAGSDLFCLRFHSIQLKVLSNYETLLESMIFRKPTAGIDSKTIKKNRRILRTTTAYQILALLWKESEFIDNQLVAQVGLRKIFDEKAPLTAHSLAANLAESGSEVATLNSRIRNIGIAASAFDLVERVSLTSTNVPLKGTVLLHQFMTKLAHQNLSILNELSPEFKATAAATSEER